MFVYMLKTIGNTRCLVNVDRRCLGNLLDQPPPIPPRQSLLNTTNKNKEGQFVRPGETPVKPKRTILRSRNVRRRDPPLCPPIRKNRSDSADNLDANSSDEVRCRYVSRRAVEKPIEQETYSD